MPADLYNIIYELQGNGVFEFLLPFLLIFTLAFAILEKTKILGEDKKNINAVIALIMGLLMVTQFEIVQTMNNFLPKISLFLVIAVMFLVMVSLFGANLEHGFSGIFWALGPSLGFEVPYWIESSWQTVLFVIIIVVIIFMIVGGSNKGRTFKNRAEDIGSVIDKWLGK